MVGNGMVGYRFCEKLTAKVRPGTFEIVVFGKEPRQAYDRVHLSEYFDPDKAAGLLDTDTLERYAERGIDYLRNVVVNDSLGMAA